MFFVVAFFNCKPDVKPTKSNSSQSTPKFTLSFEANNGIKINSQSIEEGKLGVKPVDPRRADYTFAGWFKDNVFTQDFDFLKDPIEADLTLYAKWIANPTVTFTVNGGSAVANGRSFYNDVVSKPTDPTRANFTFGGWFRDSALTQAFDFNTKLTADITLYAKWLAKSIITFDVDGGSAIANVLVDRGGKITKPADPTKAGYTFINWYAENTYQNVFDFNTTINSDTTLYGKFNREPVLKAAVNDLNINSFRHAFSPFISASNPVTTQYQLNNFFTDPDGDTLTYTVVSAFQNGGNDDKKNSFTFKNGELKGIGNPKTTASLQGYYKIRLKATDPWGASVELYTVCQMLDGSKTALSFDYPSLNYSTYSSSGGSTNYYRLGSGDDIFYTPNSGIYDGGSGNNIYQINNSGKKIYIYNFKNGDKIQFEKTGHFKDYQFSSYTNPSDVVATGNDRIIYITSTGELYRDENGDAVYKTADGTVDLKTGSKEHRIAKLYKTAYNPGDAAETNGTPADFGTSDFEIVDI